MKNLQISGALVVLRWITRVVSTLLVVFLVYLLLSYTVGPETSIPGLPMMTVIFLFAAGVVLGWFREGWAGMVILAGCVLFFVLYPNAMWPPELYHVMPLTAILFLLCWFKLCKPQAGALKNK